MTMPNHNIMKFETLDNLNYSLVHKDCLEQFVISVLIWYQQYEPVRFQTNEGLNLVPNIFNIFEYPSAHGDSIINLFIESDMRKTSLLEGAAADLPEIKVRSIEAFNSSFEHIYLHMIEDIRTVLDAYRLFYCYEDDAIVKGKYFNPYVKEVW